MKTPTLRALHEGITPTQLTIEDDVCTIGRSEMCHIVVTLELISRIHATIEQEGPRFVLEDAQSTNGTYVNGSRLQGRHRLSDQDVIGLGKPTPLLRFEDADTTVKVSQPFFYDAQTMQFYYNHQPVELTPQEFRLLLFLYESEGTVCERAACAEAIWEVPYNELRDSDRLDRKISNLRGKLRKMHPTGKSPIETRRGLGYILKL